MPTNDQDARALTYLARRLRHETNGAGEWDDAGTYAVISRLVGQQLASVVERVTRHAADAEAKTPGAIHRPFVPPIAVSTPGPAKVDGSTCGICSQPEAVCRQMPGDHEFVPLAVHLRAVAASKRARREDA